MLQYSALSCTAMNLYGIVSYGSVMYRTVVQSSVHVVFIVRLLRYGESSLKRKYLQEVIAF